MQRIQASLAGAFVLLVNGCGGGCGGGQAPRGAVHTRRVALRNHGGLMGRWMFIGATP